VAVGKLAAPSLFNQTAWLYEVPAYTIMVDQACGQIMIMPISYMRTTRYL